MLKRCQVIYWPENIEDIYHRQNDSHVAGWQQCGQVLHGVVQVACEAVFDKQSWELEYNQQQLPVLFIFRLVARQRPVDLTVTASLQHLIEFIQYIGPV